MRNAQRTIISILLQQERPLSKTFIVKIAFLLSKETPQNQLGPFYKFLPYKYGPFSFVLYRDISNLAQTGWITKNNRLEILAHRKSEAEKEVEKMPRLLRCGVSNILEHYGFMSSEELINLVYSRYKSYTYFSEYNGPDGVKPFSISPPDAPIAIYTIGYEGESVDGFLDACVQNGIRQLLDVRNNPISRKWGFSKRRLSDLCHKMKMEYHHLPELGIPASSRKNLGALESYEELLDHYEKSILPQREKEKCRALELVYKKASALMCMEADVAYCHRGRLAKELAYISGLPIKHLKTQ